MNGNGKGEKPSLTITIQVYPDSRVEVGGFPDNYHAAMGIMQAGVTRVSNHFVAMAMEAKLDERLSMKRPRIIQPGGSPIVVANGPIGRPN
jgi:hypothetical protein